eukprot:TRINITY_DN7640_c0_g1_i1.p1 TRINITY_DN7640_c0_g1~~TRINITY_DN7640_c0_g1_i1.p1  ORF type:complete len:595 (+),score=110.58 TRINITY_DN7640_c0_g1_i1:142-1926(+)
MANLPRRIVFLLLGVALVASFTLDESNTMRDKLVYRHSNGRHVKLVDTLPSPEPLSLHELAGRLTQNAARDRAELASQLTPDPPIPDDYYAFIPIYVGEILPGASLSWSAPCFGESSATVSGPAEAGKPVTVELELSKPSSLTCSDHYVFMTVGSWHHESYTFHGKHTLEWHNLDGLELTDVNKYGIRVFRLRKPMPATIADIYETAKLFTGAMKKGVPGVPQAAAESNLKFLKDYANFTYAPRSEEAAAKVLGPADGVNIQSGDLIGIIRLDGLDPLIAWGTASRLGHTTMALEIDGVMHVVESQAKSNYWPKNFVQRTELGAWLTTAHAADYNVLHLPLSAERRAMFNATKCLEWFETQVEGLLYGYPTLLSGWVDTADQNLPTMFGGGSHQLLGTVFSLLDPLLMKYVYKPNETDTSKFPSMPNIWSLTMAKRAGMPSVTASTTVQQAYAYAYAQNISLGELLESPEQDSWVYPAGPGYKEGPAMVCNVFVCNAWRAGGVLTNQLNCGELTPFDLYELKVFSDEPRSSLPAACLAADPDSTQPYCQLMGKYTIDLDGHYNVAEPFDHMREHCTSQAPEYKSRFSVEEVTKC